MNEYKRLREVDIESNVGNRVYVMFMARNIDVRSSPKGGGEYIVLDMVDGSKTVEARIFGITPEVKETIASGRVYKAAVDIKTYKKNGTNSISCIIYTLEPCDISPVEFISRVENIESYVETIKKGLELIKGTIYGDIAYNILTRYWDKFVAWPAGKSIHHTDVGGLVQHTACVLRGAVMIANIYNGVYGDNFINLPLLICGSILHDVMKVKELEFNAISGEANYSNCGALSSHILECLYEIDSIARELGVEDCEEVNLLKHVIAAHHGKLEFGSPVKACTPEAHILSVVDNLDADIWQYNRDMQNIKAGEYTSVWRGGELFVRYKDSSKE